MDQKQEREAFAAWVRDGIANFIADNWPDRKHTLAEIEAGVRAIEIRPDAARAQRAGSGFEVRVAGPDDLHHFGDELDALRFANRINQTYLADLLAHPGDEVLCLATVHCVDVSQAKEPK